MNTEYKLTNELTDLFKDITPHKLNLLHENKSQSNRSIILGSQDSIKTLADSTTTKNHV